MTRLALLLLLISLLLTPAAAASTRGGTATVTQDFDWIRQGQVGLVRVSGASIANVEATFFTTRFRFFRTFNAELPEGLQEWAGILAAPMTARIGFHETAIIVTYNDGTIERIDERIRVAHGEFGRQDLILPTTLTPLLEESVNTRETAVLQALIGGFQRNQFWRNGGFIQPSDRYVSSAFGTWRYFNGMRQSLRHTGIDYPTPTGSDIIAVADGVVVFVGEMDIRGKYVLIDHGWGIFSGYAHAESLIVTVGDRIEQGDVIGSVGSTGRSTGPHLHFEIAVSGIWVHPLVFIPLINDVITE
ncbi:MAG: M23 family metallopeptidase [Chloroflexi bacterium]|nr:M23 family metallopeptidase [Chloroflexota bacterium]